MKGVAYVFVVSLLIVPGLSWGQKDNVKYVPPQVSGVIEQLRTEADSVQAVEDSVTAAIRARQERAEEAADSARVQLRLDFSKIAHPESPSDFKSQFHFPPVGQFRTGTCWCFSTTSFIESEVYRQTGTKIKLSEMFTVYYEYVEKARRYVRERGDSWNGEGSESNAVTRIMKLYGAVPAESYSGRVDDRRFDHVKMSGEIADYLDFIKKSDFWDEEKVVGSVKLILNKYMGAPPQTIVFNGRTMTPLEFVRDEMGIELDDFVSCMSTLSRPFYSWGEFAVPDNWWHDSTYYNLPLDLWYEAIKNAIKSGYTMELGGDISEPGYSGADQIAIIPTFDIPRDFVDQDAREFRFDNETTTDDHGLHLVGYARHDGHDWYLMKDSSRRRAQGRYEGYIYYRDDYVRLKMLTFMVHKDALKGVIKLAEKRGKVSGKFQEN